MGLGNRTVLGRFAMVVRLLAALGLVAAGLAVVLTPGSAAAQSSTISYRNCPSFGRLKSDLENIPSGEDVTVNFQSRDCNYSPSSSRGMSTITLGDGVNVAINGNGLTFDGGNRTFDLIDLANTNNPSELTLNQVTLENAPNGVQQLDPSFGDEVDLEQSTVNGNDVGVNAAYVLAEESTLNNDAVAILAFQAEVEGCSIDGKTNGIMGVNALFGDVDGSYITDEAYGIFVNPNGVSTEPAVDVAGSLIAGNGIGVFGLVVPEENLIPSYDVETSSVIYNLVGLASAESGYLFGGIPSLHLPTASMVGPGKLGAKLGNGPFPAAIQTLTPKNHAAFSSDLRSRVDAIINRATSWSTNLSPKQFQNFVKPDASAQMQAQSTVKAASAAQGTLGVYASTISDNLFNGVDAEDPGNSAAVILSVIDGNGSNGVYTVYAEADILDSTISNNLNVGVWASAGNVQASNSTISDNGYYGIEATPKIVSFSPLTLQDGEVETESVTVSGNNGGIFGHALALTSTILDNIPTPNLNRWNCRANLPGQAWFFSNVLSNDASCSGNNAATVVTDSQLKLGPLGYYGGPQVGLLGYQNPLETVGLGPGSVAIDAIPASGGPGSGTCDDGEQTDQRGFDRPQGAGCDIGAFEVTSTPVVQLLPAAGSSTTVNQGYYAVIRVELINTSGKVFKARQLSLKSLNLISPEGQTIPFSYTFRSGRVSGTNVYQLSINTRNLEQGPWTLQLQIGNETEIPYSVVFWVQ